MVTAAQHLWETPAIWINLDRSVERRRAFEQEIAPWLSYGSPWRLSGVDGRKLDPDEALAWKRRVRNEARAAMGFQPPRRRLDAPGNRVSYARALGLRGCELSHRTALRWGLAAGWSHFLVLEDDARVRWELYSTVEIPSNALDVVMWGGLRRGNHARDAARPAARHRWQPLNDGQVVRVKATHAYEVSRAAAEHLLNVLESRDTHVDQGGIWPTVQAFPSVVSEPQLITTDRYGLPSLTRGDTLIRRT